jgi:WD40 repeat protein/serine/threonine protein kinase
MPSNDDLLRCPQCGLPLPADAPASRLCPACLFGLGLEERDFRTEGAAAGISATLNTKSMPPGALPVQPERIGPYRILQPLKEGGMGIVYLAEQQEPIRRRVALKLIKLGMDSREIVARFESERQALALMDHQNIARVFDAGAAPDGRPYFAMEYVPGLRITQYCDEHRLSNQERVGLFTQVCAAVQHAHQKGVVHRDLKPSNVLVMVQDGQPVPKIIDFGVAKAINQPLTNRTVFTQHGRIVGTLEYMSPEQAAGAVDIDATTDIYSLGVLLYELLVGTLPFDSTTLREAGYAEMQRVIREDEPARPSTRLSGLGDTAREVARLRDTDLSSLERELRGDLDWITMKAMEKDRGRRYASASELGSDLNRHLSDEPVVARPPSATYRIAKFVRRHKGAVAAAAAVVSALAVALAISTLSYSKAEEARRALQEESYVANIRAADLHLRSGEIVDARRRLASADPELRGWEWRYLMARSDGSVGMLSSGGGAPTAIGVTPDGHRLFWLSAYGVLRMADATTLEQMPDLTRPRITKPGETPEYVIGISRDGTRYASVASADYAETVIVQEGPNKIFRGVGTGPPGKEGDTILIKETTTGRILATLASRLALERGLAPRTIPPFRESDVGIPLPVSAVFSQNGRYVTTWSAGHVLKVLDLATGRSIAEFRGHQNTITSGEFSPDATHFASGSFDGTVRLWNLRTGVAEKVITHEGSVWAVAFSPNGRELASGGSDQSVRLWDLTGALIARLSGHTGGIQALAFAPDGKRLASASVDRSIRVWNTTAGSLVTVLVGHTKTVTSLAFVPRGLVSGSIDSTVRLWDPDPAVVSVIAPLSPLQRRLIALSPNGRHVAVAGSDGFIRVWERGNPSEVRAFPMPTSLLIRDLTFTADGARLVFLSDDQVRVWDVVTTQTLSTRVWPKPPLRLSLLADGQRGIETTADGALRIWNIEGTDAPADLSPGLGQTPDRPADWVVSSNNERVAVGSARRLGVWNIRRRTRLLLVDLNAFDIPSRIGAVALSSDGTRVASGHEDGAIRLWDVPSGLMRRQFTAHDGPVRWLAFSPIGTRLMSAAAGSDRKVRIWHALPPSVVVAGKRPTAWTGEPLLTLELENAVQGLAMSADGTTLATLDTSLHVWNTEPLHSAETRLTADLLREGGMTSTEAISTLRTDSPTNAAQQREALKYVAAHGDNPEELRARAWHIVSGAGRTPDAYARAMTLAESAQQGAPYLPGGSVSTTLGATYYRVGRYTEALAWLHDGLRLRPRFATMDSANLAFIAMAHHRLGQIDEAHRELKRLESILSAARELKGGIRHEQITLAAEAASVVRGPSPPK